MSNFIEALLPLHIPGTYTYRVPEGMSPQVGSRVLVPFGRKKIYTAIVVMLHDRAPQGYEVKEVLSVLDDRPVLRHPSYAFGNGLPTTTFAQWARFTRLRCPAD